MLEFFYSGFGLCTLPEPLLEKCSVTQPFYLSLACFKVTDKTNPFYIDGEDVKQSNWLRYVNRARTKQEHNCEAYQYRGCIYYKTLREITIGECNSWCLV